jgi:4-amino-4-deoxy-L-arabinose transferase-like glycosyltransferase
MASSAPTHQNSVPLAERNPLALLFLSIIVLISAFFRFHSLGVRSLWPPECFSVLVAREPWPQFLRTMWWGEGNMAFYYTLLRGWLHLHHSDAWIQGLSAVFGVLTIPAIYALGQRFLSRKAGLIAAGILAIHSFHVERSQLVRSYSLLTLVVVLLTYAFLALLDSPESKFRWALYVVLGALAFYAQTFAVFILAAQWLAVGWKNIKRLGILRLLLSGVAIAVLSLPLLAVMVFENKGQLDWVPPLSVAGVLDVIWGAVGANMLALHNRAESAALLILYAVGWIFVFRGLRSAGREQAGEKPSLSIAVPMFAWLFAFPIVAMIAISIVKPILYPRFLLMCAPFAILHLAQGLTVIETRGSYGRGVSYIILIFVAILSLIGTREYEMSLKTPGLDWRGVTNYILARSEPGDAVIFYTFGGNWTWEYYVDAAREAGDAKIVPPTIFPLPFDTASIESRTAPYRRLWLVLQQDIPTPASDANTELLVKTVQQRFRIEEEKEFPGVSIYPGEEVTIHLSRYAAAGLQQPQ